MVLTVSPLSIIQEPSELFPSAVFFLMVGTSSNGVDLLLLRVSLLLGLEI